jgi:molecular chaperone GrpE
MTARRPVKAARGGDGTAEVEPGAAQVDDAAPPEASTAAETPEEVPVAAAPAEPDERYLRLAADFENFRRRKAQELIDRSRYASEDAAKALLPVLDNLRRAIGHAADAGNEAVAVSGLELVVREFETALEQLGVEAIEAKGRPFDPSVHEAIGGEDSEDVEVDTVADELQRGYRLHDRVIRPSLVRVAHPATPAPERS